ncbi:MAG: hypothetical protein ACRETL_08160, partial [Gammaproteobacteria bacterium]
MQEQLPRECSRNGRARMTNRLYFGDNLHVLREHVADASVDLIYLDPPFNSKRDYNLLFKTPKGHESDAQITAFEDSWHWGEQAEREFNEILHQSNTDVAQLMPALRAFLGENDMMAYLAIAGWPDSNSVVSTLSRRTCWISIATRGMWRSNWMAASMRTMPCAMCAVMHSLANTA